MRTSKNKNTLLLEVIQHAPHVCDVDSLNDLLDGPLKALMKHEVMICGTGFYLENGGFGHQYHNRGFPEEYFLELRQPDGSIDSPLMQQWRATRRPVWFQSKRDDHLYPAEWVAIFNKYQLRNTVGHTMLNYRSRMGSTFIFARLAGQVGPAQTEILEQITPSLCLALSNALAAPPQEDDFPGAAHHLLSRKQCEILQWVHLGKTNWEISKIIDITEDTVKYHINQAMNKLGVRTRAQAIGMALELGLISPHGN